jgi:hypothetical protein
VDIAIISSTGEMGSMDSGTGATLAFVSLEGITFYAG